MADGHDGREGHLEREGPHWLFLEFKVRIWAFFAHAAPICLFYAFRHLNKPFYIQKSKGIKCARRNGAS